MANPSPAITFTVDLSILASEAFGPDTNQTDTGVLQPDQYGTSPDTGRTQFSNRRSTRSSWTPTLTLGNRVWKHGDSFTEYGLQAVYLRDMYGVGYAPADRAILTITA